MRTAFGFVSILLAVAIILIVMHAYSGKSNSDIKAGQKAQDVVRHMTNTGADGTRADRSITLQEVNADGKLTGMKVAEIMAGGPMQTNFGLQKGDTIVRLDGARIGELDMGDYEMAKAQLFSPHGPEWRLTVLRSGMEVTLPAAH